MDEVLYYMKQIRQWLCFVMCTVLNVTAFFHKTLILRTLSCNVTLSYVLLLAVVLRNSYSV